MLTKEQELAQERVARDMRPLDTAILVIAMLMMCESELEVIRKLWFRAGASFDAIGAFSIPVAILIPGLFGISISLVIRGLGKKGEINPATVARLRFSLAMLLMMTYLAIMMLASMSAFS
jgi:hypothetical protein